MFEMRSESVKNWYVEGVDKVLSGESKLEIREGEGVGARIHKETTEIYSTLDEGNPIYCTIETTELRELIEIWWKEYLEFNKDRLDMILIDDNDRIWAEVKKAMDEETAKYGLGHKLDPEKYKKMGEDLKKKYNINS